MREAKALMKMLEKAHIYFVPRHSNGEVNAIAIEKVKEVMVDVITVKLPLFQGKFQL